MSNICRWALCTDMAEPGNVYCSSHPPEDNSPTITKWEDNGMEIIDEHNTEPEEAPCDDARERGDGGGSEF